MSSDSLRVNDVLTYELIAVSGEMPISLRAVLSLPLTYGAREESAAPSSRSESDFVGAWAGAGSAFVTSLWLIKHRDQAM